MAIAGLIGWTINTIIQNIQTAKIKAKGVELELRTKELEKKNGKEQKEINELKQKVENLERLNNLLVEKVLSKSELKSRN